jgi:hypothetical protein
MKKTSKFNVSTGGVYPQIKSANSITFCAELPENAKIESIRIIGEVETNGIKRVNPFLEDIDGVVVVYHKDRSNGEIATAYFLEGLPEKVYLDVQSYILADFEVTYTEVCPCCGR